MKRPESDTRQLLRLALEAACAACGVTVAEVAAVNEHNHLRRSAPCVTARMTFVLVVQMRAPKIRMVDRTAAINPDLYPELSYQWRAKAKSYLATDSLVEVHPNEWTPTTEAIMEPFPQVLNRALAEFDRKAGDLRPTQYQAMSEARKARRPA